MLREGDKMGSSNVHEEPQAILQVSVARVALPMLRPLHRFNLL